MLRAIYKSGSSVILPNPRDEDFVHYYDTIEERRNALIKNHNHKVDNHYELISNATKVRLWCYEYRYMKYVEGEEIKELKEFSIFDHKQEYLDNLRYYAQTLKREDKKWYHLYIAIRMFEKGKMTINNEEKRIAQQIHDEGIDDTNYQYIIDYLENNK